ncbi:23S rRNA (pseudouridine(1915)-N(3))-methyltransferase RlmH [Myxococcota bacterium]
MKLAVVAVGRLRPPELRALADQYLGRIRRYARCDEWEVREAGRLQQISLDGARHVALDVTGERLTSLEFAARLDRWTSTGKGAVAFFLGGADGIPEPLLAGAHHRLSLSSLTFPHRLARVLLYEQLYRALTILRHEPYARED